MGKVFSWEEVKERRVPRLADFDHIRQVVDVCLDSYPDVLGALAYGSFIYGSHTVRSDMDYLVVYRAGRRTEVDSVLNAYVRQAYALHIPLQFTKQDEGIARTSFSHVGVLFAAHLEHAVNAGGVIGRNPLDFFSFNAHTALEELRSYLANKIRSFEEHLSSYSTLSVEKKLHFLKLVLEAPIHTARKVVQLVGGKFRDGDSKEEVCRTYASCVPSYAQMLASSVELDTAYSRELIEQLASPNEERYGIMLSRIERHAGEVLEYLCANALFLSGKIGR